VAITGSRARWHVSSDASWLAFSPTSGTGPGGVTVTATAAAQVSGTLTGTLTVTDDDSGGTLTFPATLTTRAPRLLLSASAFTFNLDSTSAPSALAQGLTVTDELEGKVSAESVSWTLQSVSAPWLQLLPSSGGTAPSANPSVSVNTTELAKLPWGTYIATMTLGYQSADGYAGTVAFPVTLNDRISSVSFVGSYIGIANQPGQLYVRGANFSVPPAPLTVNIGSTAIAGLIPDSDTQVRVSYPALPAGTYPVSIQNQLGIVLTNAQLVVVSPSALTYQAISAPSTRTRLVYDAERTTLYGVNAADQEIEEYQLAGGTWIAASPTVVVNLTDIALTPNGRSLIVLSKQEVNELVLPVGSSAIQARAPNPDQFCGQYLSSLAMTNDGKAFIPTFLAQCSGYSNAYLYDVASQSIRTTYTVALYDGIVAGSADGSRLFAGIRGISPTQPIEVFSALNDSLVATNTAYEPLYITVSGDASRVILDGQNVYSGSMTQLGNLPTTVQRVLLSRDSKRAYAYSETATAGAVELDIYDLTGALGAGALYPLLKAVPLADHPNAESNNPAAISMAETPDGQAVFISGDSKIIVQPVN
jgi:hypothetical protein